MSKRLKVILGILLLLGLATASHQALRAARIQEELRAVNEAENGERRRQISLRNENLGTTEKLALLEEELQQLRLETSEIHKLRAEVAHIQKATDELKSRHEIRAAGKDELRQWIARLEKLERWMEEHPEKQIPELKYLVIEDWLDVVKDSQLPDENSFRHAALILRERASMRFSDLMGKALVAYRKAHKDGLPPTPSHLREHFDHPVDDAILARYEMLPPGYLFQNKLYFIAEKERVDNDRFRKIIGPETSLEEWAKVTRKK